MHRTCCKIMLPIAVLIVALAPALGEDGAASDAVIETPPPEFLPFDVEDRLAPGVILELESRVHGADHASRSTDVRHARMINLSVGGPEAASPFLPAGEFQAVWRGYLYSDSGATVRFIAEGSGESEVQLNGRKVLTGADRQSRPVQVHAGFTPVRVSVRSSAEGDMRFKLLWSGKDFIPEPVLPTALFHDPLDPQLVERKKVRTGRELFATHSCLKCHSAGGNGPSAGMPELAKDNPDLKGVDERLEPDWIVQWLLDPVSLRNEATMPAVALGANRDERRAAATDIAAFLTQQSSHDGDAEVDNAVDDPLVDEGELLFEQYGCIACHRFTPPAEEDYFDRVSLHFAGAKFRRGALRKFLQAPTEHYAWTRMPDMQLSEADASALAACVRDRAKGACETPADVSSADPQRGEQMFHRSGCANCHPVADTGSRVEAVSLAAGLHSAGCLGPSGQDAKAPEFSFSDEERAALLEFGKTEFDSLARRSTVEISRRYVALLRCHACHERDGEMNLLGDVLLDESTTGKPPEVVPQLTWAGEKLRRNWLENLFAGRLEYRARPWLKIRMPHFPVRAADLAAGLAAEHGELPDEPPPDEYDPQQADIGKLLTRQAPQGFFCVQCHAVGDQPAVGAFDHKGINFAIVTKRIRRDFYRRWITDPMRIDPGSKMPKLAPDGKTTVIKTAYDGDAQKQFDAIWHYLQSLDE